MSGNYIVAAAVILMAALALVINYSALAAASEAEEMEIYSRWEWKMDKSKFRTRLLEQLDKHNMTQHQLAVEVKVSDAAVSRWLSGQSLPRFESIGKISMIFDVSLGYLLGED